MPLIDMHQHIVYGVDDGAKTIEDSGRMLKVAAQQGIRTIVCTSHVSHRTTKEHMMRYKRHLATLMEEQSVITLLSGAEILYSEDCIPMLKAGILPTLAETKSVLIEFLPTVFYEMILRAIMDLSAAGFTPVLAHVERYDCLHYQNRLRELHDTFHVKTQMNTNTVLCAMGLFGDRWVKNVLRQGLIDIVSSDAHNTKERPCNFEKAYNALCKLTSADEADALCGGNAEKLLQI